MIMLYADSNLQAVNISGGVIYEHNFNELDGKFAAFA